VIASSEKKMKLHLEGFRNLLLNREFDRSKAENVLLSSGNL